MTNEPQASTSNSNPISQTPAASPLASANLPSSLDSLAVADKLTSDNRGLNTKIDKQAREILRLQAINKAAEKERGDLLVAMAPLRADGARAQNLQTALKMKESTTHELKGRVNKLSEELATRDQNLRLLCSRLYDIRRLVLKCAPREDLTRVSGEPLVLLSMKIMQETRKAVLVYKNHGAIAPDDFHAAVQTRQSAEEPAITTVKQAEVAAEKHATKVSYLMVQITDLTQRLAAAPKASRTVSASHLDAINSSGERFLASIARHLELLDTNDPRRLSKILDQLESSKLSRGGADLIFLLTNPAALFSTIDGHILLKAAEFDRSSATKPASSAHAASLRVLRGRFAGWVANTVAVHSAFDLLTELSPDFRSLVCSHLEASVFTRVLIAALAFPNLAFVLEQSRTPTVVEKLSAPVRAALAELLTSDEAQLRLLFGGPTVREAVAKHQKGDSSNAELKVKPLLACLQYSPRLRQLRERLISDQGTALGRAALGLNPEILQFST